MPVRATTFIEVKTRTRESRRPVLYYIIVKYVGKWIHYDGMKEKQCPGSGLFQHNAQLGTPSHCFYVQL